MHLLQQFCRALIKAQGYSGGGHNKQHCLLVRSVWDPKPDISGSTLKVIQLNYQMSNTQATQIIQHCTQQKAPRNPALVSNSSWRNMRTEIMWFKCCWWWGAGELGDGPGWCLQRFLLGLGVMLGN